MRKIRLTESELINLVKSIILEVESSSTLEGRKYTINPDYTLSIADRKGAMSKIKMSGSKMFMDFDINVQNINSNPQTGSYSIVTKKGNKYDLDKNTVNKIINFVDTNTPAEIDLGKATLKLQKIA